MPWALLARRMQLEQRVSANVLVSSAPEASAHAPPDDSLVCIIGQLAWALGVSDEMWDVIEAELSPNG